MGHSTKGLKTYEPAKPIHFSNKAKKLKEKLHKTGYNGIRLRMSIQTNERVPDEQTVVKFREWNKNYVVFNIEPDFGDHNIQENDYVEVHIDSDKFWDDLDNYFRAEFGIDATVKFRAGCSEFQIYREDKI